MVHLEYIMDDYAEQFECCQSSRRRSNQLVLCTELMQAWAPAGGQERPSHHNEVLTNLHADMILGVLSHGGTSDRAAQVRSDFSRQFGRELKVIHVEGGLS